MERQRALMAAVAGGLRTQQLGQLQQPARRAAGAEPDHAGARPMAEIVEPHAEAGLHDAAGQFAQRQLFLRGDLAEKRQRQVQISRHHRSAGLRRKRLGAPADHLLLQGIRQGQSEKQAARIGHGGSVNNDKSVGTEMNAACNGLARSGRMDELRTIANAAAV